MGKIFKNCGFLIFIFAVTLFFNCFMVYGQTLNKKDVMTDMANNWAEAWTSRDGELRYDMMSDKMKKEFEEKQGILENGKLNTSIRWSSPWVERYIIDVDEETETAEIKYVMADSGCGWYVMWDYIAFNYNEYKGEMEVVACNTSDLFGYADAIVQSLTGTSYEFMDNSSIPAEMYYHAIDETVKSMISSEAMYKNKNVYSFLLKQTSDDNIGKMAIDDIDVSVTYNDFPINPAKDESLRKLKTENYDEYIKLFSEYNNAEKTENYNLRVKVDLETEGIVSIELKHKEKVE